MSLRSDLRRPADLSEPADLRADLAPVLKSCVFDRDCGDADQRCCGGTCRAYLDRDNCGACGTSCGADPAVVCCGDKADARCSNIRTSQANCGRCGGACPMGRHPTKGTSYQFSCCDGICSDPYRDDANCGMCGTMCGVGKKCCFINGFTPTCDCN